MTNTILSIVFLTTIMMTAAIAASIEIIPEAEGLKSAGSDAPGRAGANSYGSANKGIVCGDRLCSEYPGGYEQFKKDLILEGIFGTGFDKKVIEPHYSIISAINDSKAYVISNDFIIHYTVSILVILTNYFFKGLGDFQA